jgi:hypothetical protein
MSKAAAVRLVLPEAIALSADGGFRFPIRNLYYVARRLVLKLLGPIDLAYKQTFCREITDWENEHGDIAGMVRDARGRLWIPHTDEVVDLDTMAVEQFERPEWVFNKLIAIEKEGLAEVLIADGWHNRNDCAVIGGKGYGTRAQKDILDKMALTPEPLWFGSIHDADADGTHIHHTLQEATPARGRRLVEIVDLGLQPWEAIAMGLEVERFEKSPKHRAVGAYVRERTDLAPDGTTWETWLQTHRVELNAMRSRDFIAWVDGKMVDLPGKVVPADEVVRPSIEGDVRWRLEQYEREREAAGPWDDIPEHYRTILLLEAPLRARIARLERRIERVAAPYRRRIEELERKIVDVTDAEMSEIDRLRTERDDHLRARIEQALARLVMPDEGELAEMVRAAIADRSPTARWNQVLRTVAHEIFANEVGDGGEESDE